MDDRVQIRGDSSTPTYGGVIDSSYIVAPGNFNQLMESSPEPSGFITKRRTVDNSPLIVGKAISTFIVLLTIQI